MCLLALAWQMDPEWPLVVVANRDERHDRPAATLSCWSDSRIVAGRDLEAGGTWMGLTGDTRWAALTNVREPGLKPGGGPSRGGLVTEFLQSEDSPQAFYQRHAASFKDYAGFNLLLRAGDQLGLLSNRGSPLQILPPGVYGLSNAALNTPWPKVQRLRAQLQAGLPAVRTHWLQWLSDRQTAADAELPDTGVGLEIERLLSAVFIANPVYGTRCSTLVLQGRGEWEIQEQSWTPHGQPGVLIHLRG